MKDIVESNGDFQSVVTVAAGYLAITWLLIKTALSQTDAGHIYAFCLYGMLVQCAFGAVFRVQQKARCKQLDLSCSRFPLVKTKDDVVLTILNCVMTMILYCIAMTALAGLIAANHPHAKIHPFSF